VSSLELRLMLDGTNDPQGTPKLMRNAIKSSPITKRRCGNP
jgi:hypothetical protein